MAPRAQALLLTLIYLCTSPPAVAQSGLAGNNGGGNSQTGGVKIVAVNPTRGSLAGGTRIHIRGSGFSSNTGEGNLVFIGDIPCDPIPLHCTLTQIACKTRPNLEGAYSEWNGWSKNLEVKVIANGKESECNVPQGCYFSYHYGWYHTPRIYGISPVAVSEGTIITVDGRFHSTPFSFEEVNAPSREVPLASVKVANRAGEQQQPENEPFGKSGSRCALFDPESEEPYGVVERSSSEVEEFQCRVSGPREAGRYNLSVALLGTAMHPDRDMNMGEAHAALRTYQSDHTGVSFQIQHAPRIDSISPSASGSLAGTRITIEGDSFSNDKALVSVSVMGSECVVQAATIQKIVCVLADAVTAATAPQNAVVPGARGLRMRVWRNKGNFGFTELKTTHMLNASDMEWTEEGLAEFPLNIQSAFKDARGPAAHVQGFFRPPVTSNYTFVVSSDDQSEVWMANEELNASHVSRIIDFDSWSASRLFERISWQYGRWTNHESQVARGVRKFSPNKFSLRAGEFRYMEAFYRSGDGGDNFALGAIMHTSPVNKKDSPFAIDEQQFVELDTTTNLEVHRLSVSASAPGTFALRIGGKDSRPIRFKASEGEVRAAVRELLSNCQGANGEAADSGGNTFDCFMGYGVEYRGLADTIEESGEKCSYWDAFESKEYLKDPFLQVVAGLEKNLCRNPWYSSEGPRCLNHNGHVRACKVPRCGGEDSASSPLVATFEEEEEEKGLDFVNVFEWRDGVTPRIDRQTAYCGTGSLYLPNSFGQFRQGWMKDPSKGPTQNFPYGTKDFPYMCMAYRIPPDSMVTMLINHDRANEGGDRGGSQWKTLRMTSSYVASAYALIGDWGVVADDAWHYTCIHLDHMMDNTDNEDFARGANHLVREIIFYTDEQERSTYGNNSFWIDEFSVASTPRALEQSALPDLGGVEARVASVSRVEEGQTVTWEVALASTDGSPPAATLDVVVLSGEASEASSERLQEHSPRLEGSVVVSFKGERAAWSPYASADDVRRALAGLRALGGDVTVHRTGTPQTGYGWVVYMTHVPGDQPQLEAVLQLAVGEATVAVQTVEDGGLLMGPLSADYFHVPASATGVHLVVNDGAASCRTPAACQHAIDDALTPTLSSVSQTAGAAGVYNLVINGAGFTPAEAEAGAQVEVSVGGFECVVATRTDARITCAITYPFIAPGSHPVHVVVPGKGGCRGTGAWTYALTITSVSPTSVNLDVSTVITVAGWGFHPVASSNTVSYDTSSPIASHPCAVLTVSPREITCRLSPGASASRRSARHLLATGTVQVSAGAATVQSSSLTIVQTSPPAFSSTPVSPTAASAGGGQVITISGSGFSATPADVMVLIGGHPCAVLSSSASVITCSTAPGPVGAVPLLVTVPTGDAATTYTYQLAVQSVGPATIGLGGGLELTVQGQGFVGGSDGVPVLNVEGTETFVVGLYTPKLAHEIHVVSVTGPVINEVQSVTVTASEGFFQLFVGGGSTVVMSKSVDQYVMQAAINEVLDTGTVRVFRTSQNTFEYLVEFRGEQGDVAMLSGRKCASAAASSCSSGGVVVAENVKGVTFSGHFTLALRDGWKAHSVTTTTVQTIPAPDNSTSARNVSWSNTSHFNETQWITATVPASASAAAMQAAFELLRPGVPVSVKREAGRGGIQWSVSYLQYDGWQPLPELNASVLHGSTDASVRRSQTGTQLPAGSWKVGLGGVWTADLELDASEQDVLDAVTTAFPTLHDVRVIAADGVGGQLLDRDYPRQWAIRVSRADVAGLGLERCTNPLYVDWDPGACPDTAADLFLSHHPWYWPAALPKPEDLSTPAYQDRLQASCDAEARAKNLRPGRCQARVPLETLPVCGVGSGVNPPCWEERFWKARVTHLDGAEVVYARDDSRQPGDTQKGFRAWARPDLESALAAQMLQVQTTVAAYGAGMHVQRVHSRAAQAVPCNASAVSGQSVTARVPSMLRYIPAYADLVDSDWLYKPAQTWGHGRYQGSAGAAAGVEAARGPMESAGMAAAGFSPARASAVHLPHARACNGERYTVDLWLVLHSVPDTRRMPVLSSMGPAMASGYALVVGAGARLEHWQSIAGGSVSVLSAPAPSVGAWVHIAASFDGRTQRLYVDGVAVNASAVAGNFEVNRDAALVLGGDCAPGSVEGCAGSEWAGFDGALSDVLWYNTSAVSAGAIAGHAAAANETLVATMEVRMGGMRSRCTGDCGVRLAGSRTPVIHAVEPSVAWDQALITVRGRRFTMGGAVTVQVGDHPCAVWNVTDTSVVCKLQLTSDGQRHGMVRVSVSIAGSGDSFEAASIRLTSIVSAVTPTLGSLMGGTALTVSGLGFPSTAASISISVGGTRCVVGSVTDVAIECTMDMQDEASDGNLVPISVTVAGGRAVCEPASACGLSVTTGATPTISALSPQVVRNGSVLTITGSDLPADMPEVRIGSIPCGVVAQTASQIQCAVRLGEGGVHPITVRFAAGFPRTPYDGCCLQASYAVEISSVVPSNGSVWGGQNVTVSGTGFAAVAADNSVYVAGQPGRVLQATPEYLVVQTPPLGLANDTRMGLEFDVHRAVVACNVVGQSCTSPIQNCYGNQGLALEPPLVVAPSSGPGAMPAWLVDGNSSTVWYSQKAVSSQVIALDFGSSKAVSGVIILWAGTPSASSFGVSVGQSSCDSLQALSEAVLPASSYDVWDASSSVQFPTQSVRYIELALTLRPEMERFRIKDIIIVAAPAQTASNVVSVVVAGSVSSCTAASAQDCTHSYLMSPMLFGVSPARGAAGDVINITGSGFNGGSCAGHSVRIGSAVCAPQACTSSWLTCAVGAHSAGAYAVELTVAGVGKAAGTELSFTYDLVLSLATPSEGGFGGGSTVTIAGSGFNADASLNVVSICDAACPASAATNSAIECTRGRVGDVSRAVDSQFFTAAVNSGVDDAMEDGETGTIIAVGGTLRFDKFWDYPTSLKTVFLRFSSLDIANNATIAKARLIVRSGENRCEKHSVIRVLAEAADDSEAFRSVRTGSLGSRPVTETYADWVIAEAWKWVAESEESRDISAVIQEVVSRPGWRAGNALTIVLKQLRNADNNIMGCEMLSYESGTMFAAKLRLEVNPPASASVASLPCSVSVSSALSREDTEDVERRCMHGRRSVVVPAGVTASSSQTPSAPGSLFKEVFDKQLIPAEELLWHDASGWCTRQSSRLCLREEILDPGTGLPFFGAQTPVDANSVVKVPVWRTDSDSAKPHVWIDVSSPLDDDYDCGADDCPQMGDVHWHWGNFMSPEDNAKSTKLIPCCGHVGHAAYMAADGDVDTYWHSGDVDAAALTLDLGQHAALVMGLEIRWRGGYAADYSVLSSLDGSTWVEEYREKHGDGGVDQVSLPKQLVTRHLRLAMHVHAGPEDGYAVAEVAVHGCSLQPELITASVAASSALFTAERSRTPTIASVVPSLGTTAGGSDVTITGSFFTTAETDLTVSFGAFPCAIQTVAASGQQQVIKCKTSASGILNGGKKWITVESAGHGATAPSPDAVFWYIDAWSARTTWGGEAPPTGCGSWVDDQGCTDSVVIPAGQVILLDVSLPRFYLILVEGTLIFDRTDLSVGASYILVRGGTLQIGTESQPFEQQATITLYGHPKSIDLPTFGTKVIACYQCTLDIHGKAQVAWTSLAATAAVGATSISVQDTVAWPVGSKIVIATTDFESPWSSHTEVATVASLSGDGRTVGLTDIGVCSNYSFSGLPLNCRRSNALSYSHLGETRTFDGRVVEFRAEVGLLSRNIVIVGDHDARLCPLADTAEDGITKLSCNQFGGQIFLHSPGHESLVARLSNFEIKNSGQAFRLGRYAIHWHMIGNVRESYQRNCSIHHSWNRGTAIHGTNFLRLESNVLYNIFGHAVFIEDGVEEYNQVVGNLGIKVTPSMALLNTDQTPAVFWIVTGKNYILRNHAVASRRYGFWFRPEISATGTSVNTPDVHPINIPLLEFDGNQAHSNGKYGLRVFDVYLPNEPSVFRNTFVWRNGAVGWTATVIGKVAFDGMISVQNGHHVFESRATIVDSWDECYVTNGLFVDDPGSLPLNPSYAAFTDSFGDFEEMGGAMLAGILLPWNEDEAGGMVISNCTFVNFANPCIRGCAHCGRGGSPVVGDGAFETRFSGMRFVNADQRALFRHPNEAFLYDMDGTLTGSGVRETYTAGGSVVGSSFVGNSVLLPNDGACTASAMSTQGTGGAVCHGHVFRRMWYHIREPDAWVGKALCVRLPHQSSVNTCQSLQPECNCLPYLKKAWKGNVWLAAVGQRYNLQMDLLAHELADPEEWRLQVWATYRMEDFYFTQRFLQWDSVDEWGRPLYWSEIGGQEAYPQNYIYNDTACSSVGCGQLQQVAGYPHTSYDVLGEYVEGVGFPGEVAIPEAGSSSRGYTVKEDADGNGVLHTTYVRGPWRTGSQAFDHRSYTVKIHPCPKGGCWPPPLPPGGLPKEAFSPWSSPSTWENTTAHPANPLNKLETVEVSPGNLAFQVLEPVVWADGVPSDGDDVWIPAWKQVVLDVDTPVLGRIVVEGTLLINASSVVDLDATWIEVKGGSLIIATADGAGKVLGPFEGSTTITLHGTNPKLAAVHGANPRETPEVVLGKEGVPLAPAGLGVMGELVARGKPSVHSHVPLAQTASRGATEITLDGVVDWEPGSEIVFAPSDFDMHQAEVVRVVSASRWAQTTIVAIDSALEHTHYAGPAEAYGTRELRMRARVGLLTRNIVIRGAGEGEAASYKAWNSQQPGAAADATCGNGICQNGETSVSCPADCVGPAYEYGATMLVAAYTEDFTYCTREYECTSGYQRSYSGSAQISHVEMRYYGQNNLRPGIRFYNLKDTNSSVSHVSMNRGYNHGISIENCVGVSIDNTVIYRSILPALRVVGGARNVVADTLAIVSIFWNTHRGATQGKGLSNAKLNAMIGMFHDEGEATLLRNNVAAGSERAGFSGAGVACGDTVSFQGNVAHSCLSGFWFDRYSLAASGRQCTALTGFQAWKIYEYAVYGELPLLDRVEIDGLRSADARVGVHIIMGGASSKAHRRVPQRVAVTDALIVGHSDNAHCDRGAPSLFACKFYMAWCNHLGLKHRGVFIAQFLSGTNMAPLISPWFNAGAYAALYGQMDLDGVTFARFGDRCRSGARAGIVDAAVSGLPGNADAADGWHPVTLRNMEKVEVDAGSLAYLDPPNPAWINQADCIDMDCDGPKHALIRDEDGTFIGGNGGAILPRSEQFSEGSFFGTPYRDSVNIPADPWWYPTVPAVMRTNRAGDLLNLTASHLKRGFGLARTGCSLEVGWNAWRCPQASQPASYRRLIIETMDADHEIRRPSPVALTSASGYTDLMNGCMDHGWCFSYTCLKRLMTFWAVVTMRTEYTVHFTGSNPQKMRLSLPYTPASENIMVKIYYQSSLRLQIFVGERRTLLEDMNLHDGRQKAQLVRDGKWTPNDGGSGYTAQLPSLTCACQIGDTCRDALHCRTASNAHGANRWNRAQGLLEIVMSGHDIDNYIDIEGMPVVSVSMGVSTSVEEFYNVKDSFISNLASLLGVSPNRISIVDVVAGNARRRLLAAGAVVSFEIEPDPEIAMDAAQVSVLESGGSVVINVTRSVNVVGACSVRYVVASSNSTTASAGVNFVAASGVLVFLSSETAKTITVSLLSEPGYSAAAATLAVVLSDPVNATLNDDTTVVSIQNVHPPAPAAPQLNGNPTSSSVPLQWALASWPDVPSAGMAAVVGWELQCLRPEISSSWIDVPVQGMATTSLFGGQPAYTLVQCRVRVQCVGGWSAWSASSTGLRTRAVCGDGTRHPTEECDDGDLDGLDGCSAACAVELGWSCEQGAGAPDVCSNGCGDGRLGGSEECDDGGNAGGDGCSGSCRVEGGWTCGPSNATDAQSASVCATTCGDGYRVALHEACDDSNTSPDDGCSATCAVESGAQCSDNEAMLSVCQTCGNSIVEGTEVCDNPASAACVACSSVQAGWRCSGSPSTCVAGPSQPTAPVLVQAKDTSLSIAWTAPNGNGLSVQSYTVEWTNRSGFWGVNFRSVASASFTIGNLTAGRAYSFRLNACHSQGCSTYGPPATFKTKAVSTASSLTTLSNSIANTVAGSTAITALVGAVNLTVTAPPPAPEAPDESSLVGLLNETEVVSDIQDDLIDEALGPPAADFGVAMTDTSPMVVSETDGVVLLPVHLVLLVDASTDHSGSRDVISCEWELTGSTAVDGRDVVSSTGAFAFAPGQATAYLLITLVDNNVLQHPHADIAFTAVIKSVTGGATLLSLKERGVTISDDEVRPTVSLAVDAVTVSQNSVLQAALVKSDALQRGAKAYYSTTAITAVAGTDYVGVTNGIVIIPAGESAGLAPVTILQGSGTFKVTIGVVEAECVPGSGLYGCGGRLGALTELTATISGGSSGGPVCGNGVKQDPEGCDDGNDESGDGCAACEVEAGYACTTSAAGLDTCVLESTPGAGIVFVRASTRVTGVSAAEFVGAVRTAFRQGVASAVSVLLTQVLVESVGRRRSESSVTVDYRLRVAQAQGGAVAARLTAAHADGSLVSALQAQGLNVTVALTSAPAIVGSSGGGGGEDPEPGPALPKKDDSDSMTLIIIICAVIGVLLLLCCCFGMWARRKGLMAKGGKVAAAPPPSAPADRNGSGATPAPAPAPAPPASIPISSVPDAGGGVGTRQEAALEEEEPLEKPTAGRTGGAQASPDVRPRSNSHEQRVSPTYAALKEELGARWPQLVGALGEAGMASEYVSEEDFTAAFRGCGVQGPYVKALWKTEMELGFPTVFGSELHLIPVAENLASSDIDKRILGLYRYVRYKGDEVDIRRLDRALEASGMAKADMDAIMASLKKEEGNARVTFEKLYESVYALFQTQLPSRTMSARLPPVGSKEEEDDLQKLTMRTKQPSYRTLGGRKEGIAAFLVTAAEAAEEQRQADRKNLPDRVDSNKA